MTDKKTATDAPKIQAFRDTRTGAIRRSKGTLGYPYVPMSAKEVKDAEAGADAQDQAGGAKGGDDGGTDE